MSKLLKFGAGLAVGAVVGAIGLHVYQKAEEDLRVELVDAVREFYKDHDIDVVWIFDIPVRVGIFKGGLIIDGKTINFEVEEGSMKVHEMKNSVEELTK